MSGTLLVTGGAGYIGSHVAWACLDAGRRVVVLDDLSTGFRDLVPAGVTFVHGSVGDKDLVGATIARYGVTAAIHLAAKTVVPDSVAHPLSYYWTNVGESIAFIDTLATAGVRAVVFSSTAAVYDPDAAAGGPLTENAPAAPISPYGRSKRMVEMVLADASAATDLRHVAMRYFNVAGADPQMRTGQKTANATHLIKVACEVAVGLRPALAVFGRDYPTRDGSCIRDFIHVSDLADAHLATLRHLEEGGESMTVNCGYGHGFSVLEVAAAVGRASGRPLPLVYEPRRPGDLMSAVSDPSRLRARLGWRPRHDSLDDIVTSALRWEASCLARPQGAL